MSIQPGIYKIVNVKGGTALDLSGGDNRTIMGFTVHGGGNQQVRYVPQKWMHDAYTFLY